MARCATHGQKMGATALRCSRLGGWLVRCITIASLYSLNPILVQTSYGMEFRWGDNPSVDAKDCEKSEFVLCLGGEIHRGDAERFERFLVSNRSQFVRSAHIAFLYSPGGDLVEALRIANLLRESLFTTNVRSSCASACFFVFVAGARRFAGDGTIGVHRPFFDRSYFANLDPSEARRTYQVMLDDVRKELARSDVPDDIVNRMFSTPSSDVLLLSTDDLLRIPYRAPWYEELLIARCGLDISFERRCAADASSSRGDASSREACSRKRFEVGSCAADLQSNASARTIEGVAGRARK